MLTDRGLGDLRAAATLIHSVPGLQAQILGDGILVAEVRRGGGGETTLGDSDGGLLACGSKESHPAYDSGSSAVVLSPCAFRAAVGQATQHHREGRPLRFLHLDDGTDPTVEISTGTGALRPGGLVSAQLDDCRIWAFATSLAPGVAHELGRSLVDDVGDLDDLLTLGLRPDPVTEISLAFARTTAEPGSSQDAAIVELLEDLMARWTIHELLVSAGVERDGARRL